MLIKRIAEWLKTLDKNHTIEVRFRHTPVDEIHWHDDCDTLAEDLEDIATRDAKDYNAGKPRDYQLMAIHTETGERTECRIPIRVKPVVDGLGQSAEKLVATALTLVQTMSDQVERYAKRDERRQEQADESFKLLEKLRSEVQERELAKEKHDHDIEVKQQMVDTAVPLGVAVINKLTGGKMPMLGAVDSKAHAVVTIVKTLSDIQQQQLIGILGERMNDLQPIIERALAGQGDSKAFADFIKSLPPEQIGQIHSILNVGQQALIQTEFGDALAAN